MNVVAFVGLRAGATHGLLRGVMQQTSVTRESHKGNIYIPIDTLFLSALKLSHPKICKSTATDVRNGPQLL